MGLKKIFIGNYVFERYVNNWLAYEVYVTRNHHYIQIKCCDECTIAGKLQDLFYDLIKTDLVEKVEV